MAAAHAARSVAVSPGGKSVYVASETADAVAVFAEPWVLPRQIDRQGQ